MFQATKTTYNTQNRITVTDSGGIIPMVSVSVTVLDGSGEPAINASAVEKGTNNYATSDFDGKIVLPSVNSLNTVVINYQGQEKAFKATEVPEIIQFGTTQLDTVIINAPIKKKFSWYTLGTIVFGLATIGFVAKAISDDKKPVKVSL